MRVIFLIFGAGLCFSSSSCATDDAALDAYLKEMSRISTETNHAIQGKSFAEKIEILQAMVTKHAKHPDAVDALQQNLAFYHSLAGQHHDALRVWDQRSNSNEQKVFNTIDGLQAMDAVETILQHSAARKIVMINEAHHVAQHRVLTYRLLRGLWLQGYRYFAVETLAQNAEVKLTGNDIPLTAGYYTSEPIFANLLLHAKQLGFQLVSYDYGDDAGSKVYNQKVSRELVGAQNIREKVFARDPEAKVLVHVGFGHIDKKKLSLAHFLKHELAIEPLTVDQASVSEKSEVSFEVELYSKIVTAQSFTNPVVFVDTKKVVWSSAFGGYDMTVIWPRTRYEFGRPDWARLGRDRLLVDSARCDGSFPCAVEVFRTEISGVVPVDRILCRSLEEACTVFIPKDSATVVVTGRDGKGRSKQRIIYR